MSDTSNESIEGVEFRVHTDPSLKPGEWILVAIAPHDKFDTSQFRVEVDPQLSPAGEWWEQHGQKYVARFKLRIVRIPERTAAEKPTDGGKAQVSTQTTPLNELIQGQPQGRP